MRYPIPAALTLKTQATKYQRKYAKRKIILFLILLVVGMFILLLVKPKHRGGPISPSASTENANKAGGLKDGAPFRSRRFLLDSTIFKNG